MIEILLVVVAAILFYKLVERKHKIVLFKILGALIGLAVLVVGAIALWYYLKESAYERRADNVSIQVVSVTPDTARFEICNGSDQFMHRVEFTVRGFMEGRSTAGWIEERHRQPVYGPGRWETTRSGFSWDIIVDPGACTGAIWPIGNRNLRRYVPHARYQVTLDTVMLSSEPTVGQVPLEP